MKWKSKGSTVGSFGVKEIFHPANISGCSFVNRLVRLWKYRTQSLSDFSRRSRGEDLPPRISDTFTKMNIQDQAERCAFERLP